MRKAENVARLTRKINFRMDEALYQKIVQGAKAARISEGEYIRRQLQAGKTVVRQEVVADVPQLKKLIAQFGKIGSNLNQIAHHYNGGGVRSREMYERTMNAVLQEVERMGGEFRGYSETYRRKKQ